MLEGLRNWSHTWSAKLLLGLLTLSMVAFFGLDQAFFGGSGSVIVATVGSSKIRVHDFQKALNRKLQTLETQMGRRISPEELKSSQLAFATLRELVTRKLLDEEAQRLGLAISNDLMREKIRAQPAFQGEDGSFSKSKFAQFLRSQGLEERTFLAEQRAYMKRQQLIQTLKCLVTAPHVISKVETSFQHQKRIGSLYVVPKTLFYFPELNSIKDKEVEAFYNEDPERFAEPMQCGFSVIVISKDLWKDQNLSDADVRKKIYNLVEVVEDGLYGGLSLEETAQKHGLVRLRVPAFPKTSDLPASLKTALSEDAANTLVNYVFSPDIKRKPHIKRLSADVQVVLDIDDVRPSFVPPLKKGTPFFKRVKKSYEEKEFRRLFLKNAMILAQEVEKGITTPSVPFGREGMKFRMLPAVTIEDNVAQVPPQVKTTLFMIAPGQVRAVQKSDGDVCLVKLLDIKQPPEKRLNERSAEAFSRANDMLFEDFIGGFLGSLRAHHHVQIHREVLTRLLS